MTRLLREVAPVVGIGLAFLALWKLLVVLGGYPPFILPPPETVAARLVSAWADGTIEPHLATTLLEIALGFSVSTLLAVATGYALARSRVAERLLSPYLVAAQPPRSWPWRHSSRSGSGPGSSPR